MNGMLTDLLLRLPKSISSEP